MNLAKRVNSILKSAALSVALAAPLAVSSSASAGVKLFPEYSIGGEYATNLAKHERINGYGELNGNVSLLSLDALTMELGAKLMTYFRSTDKTTQVQPDMMNYDVWLGLEYDSSVGTFGLSYYHQCMHDVDERDEDLISESRTHNIIRFSYEDRFDLLEGLDIKAATGLFIQVYDSKYRWMFDLEQDLGLKRINDLFMVYMRARENTILSDEGTKVFGFNAEAEVGVRITGDYLDSDIFLQFRRVEDYLKFDSGHENLLLLGVKLKSF